MIDVYPLVGGNVIKVNVELGDYVKKGQVLATIKSTDIADFEAYLKQYPKGNFKVLAENAIKRLKLAAANSNAINNANNNVVLENNTAAGNNTNLATISPITNRVSNNKPAIRYSPGQVFQDCESCPNMVAIAPAP